jgi:hypothetical protein
MTLSIRRAAIKIKNYLTYRPSDATLVHRYWQEPWDGANAPKNYAAVNPARSHFLVAIVRQYAEKSAKIMELGPNVGRNLHYLSESGYTNLHGIEISQKAVDEMRTTYPGLQAVIQCSSVEDAIKDYGNKEFDLSFSVAVLQHIPYSSNWVFPEIARVSRMIVTLEDEHGRGWRHFPRNYQRVFEETGMRQVETGPCPFTGLHDYRFRVFTHE